MCQNDWSLLGGLGVDWERIMHCKQQSFRRHDIRQVPPNYGVERTLISMFVLIMCLLCAYCVHIILWYSAEIAFSSKSNGVGYKLYYTIPYYTEVRSMLSN